VVRGGVCSGSSADALRAWRALYCFAMAERSMLSVVRVVGWMLLLCAPGQALYGRACRLEKAVPAAMNEGAQSRRSSMYAELCMRTGGAPDGWRRI
jgi:hypothetical protein